ncbi:hypothetical protein SAMN05660772_02740 [Pasteurella testudinis DSM 23072]|uniref:Uncharacterized protein n=1 Tax=Pasteurella testudinis DSM 23072 TaxID=1122938 RepID=A0A1W1V3D5_9PAST|nr:hypothetical protein [Pasteurella testudinis]SMB87800.1 hypothetical protein SAMN05660772_02740 [Pasteurella testudinis DSM 23072]SUB51594.1 Uncharacterised protein [Pasteurella testudinis]
MRKIIQIACGGEYQDIDLTTALCNDGTVWQIGIFEQGWSKFPDIPQDKEIKENETVKEITFDWDTIIRDRTLLRTRDGLKALILSKDNNSEFPLNGVIINNSGWLITTSYSIKGRTGYSADQTDDIVGYWEEANNE